MYIYMYWNNSMAEITGVLFKILSLGGKLCKVLPREILGHACQKKKKGILGSLRLFLMQSER